MKSKLDQVYAQIPASTCPPNCGRCCGILHPSLAEVSNIKEWCKTHHREFKEFHMLVGENCPYLDEQKACSIYPVRPFLCRIMGVCEDIPCPLKANKPARILSHRQGSWCYTQIYLKGKEKSRTEKHRKLLHEILKEVQR